MYSLIRALQRSWLPGIGQAAAGWRTIRAADSEQAGPPRVILAVDGKRI
ncbi:hypothetical protein ODJ79_11380 [Actinoplanes sp. KI2]|nr:hypothetical protein [Actinoplanes sp. KI2]MCU7724318.1 hypothetical protein [Actinoplanes sp. KI2]